MGAAAGSSRGRQTTTGTRLGRQTKWGSLDSANGIVNPGPTAKSGTWLIRVASAQALLLAGDTDLDGLCSPYRLQRSADRDNSKASVQCDDYRGPNRGTLVMTLTIFRYDSVEALDVYRGCPGLWVGATEEWTDEICDPRSTSSPSSEFSVSSEITGLWLTRPASVTWKSRSR